MGPPITDCDRPYFGEQRPTHVSATERKWKRTIDLEIHEWLISYNISYELFDRVDLGTRSYILGIRFYNKEDAMIFKLAWC
jgi:hypothetical protein